MISWLDLFILGFACWRISSLLVNEEGPFEIFSRLRGKFFDKPLFAGLFSCVWCMSVWIAIFMTIGVIIDNRVIVLFSLPFAVSTIAILLEQING